MDSVHNIVVIDGKNENPAKLHTLLPPIKLNKNMGMAVTSIAYGEIGNINENNNKIVVWKRNPVVNMLLEQTFSHYEFTLPPGTYRNSFEIIHKIVKMVNKDRRIFKATDGCCLSIKDPTTDYFTLKFNQSYIGEIYLITKNKNSPWHLLNVNERIDDSRLFVNQDLLEGIEPAFLYVNVIENSYINGKKSRNLSFLPLQKSKNFKFYEFNNPIYVPIEVKEFSNIFLEIRDLKGEYVDFNNKWNTVISLQIRPINRGVLSQ